MSLKSNYASTLCTASAVLATKLCFVHLATVRSRLMAKDPAIPHDGSGVLNPILSKILLCFGSDFGGSQFVFLGERLAKNCAENEPFFLLLATLCGLSGAVPSCIGNPVVATYTVARVVHSGVFLLGDKVNTSFRSVSYITGMACTLAMAGFGMLRPFEKTWGTHHVK
jgi:MAPEG family